MRGCDLRGPRGGGMVKTASAMRKELLAHFLRRGDEGREDHDLRGPPLLPRRMTCYASMKAHSRRPRVTDPLGPQILDLIYHDSEMRRTSKDSLTDWILDTQSRTDPLHTSTLLDYLAAHQPEVLNRLKINVRITDELARVLRGATPSQVSLD